MIKHYLNNKDLYVEIIISKEIGKLTPRAEKMLMLLTEKIFQKFSYTDYRDRQDIKQTALLYVFKNWYLFNENITTNAFAFYTEVIKRAAAQGYKDIYKKDYLTGEYYRPINFSQLFQEDSEINI